MLPADRRQDILELGCGTGALSAELKKRYPGARITLVELSREMLNRAVRRCRGGVTPVCGDAEVFLEEYGGRFDLIVSAAAMHWFEDPARAMVNCGRLLAAGGLFAASLFGPRTLAGLGRALAGCGGPGIAAARFPGRDEVEGMLARAFTRFRLRETLLERRYPSVIDLLRQIRNTGTGGGTRARLTPAMIRAVERAFLAEQGAVRDSFQVFFVMGERDG
jgi:malonyl-CoA O-methyltransferase